MRGSYFAQDSLDAKLQKYLDYENRFFVEPGAKDISVLDADSHIQRGQKFLCNNEESFEFGAIAITLNELLQTSNAPEVMDFLSLDVEGTELEVLGGIDFSSYKFKLILA